MSAVLPRKRHKYGAKKATCPQGHEHPSRAEARRCGELHFLQSAGKITDLVREPIFHFIINGSKMLDAGRKPVRFRPDFSYLEHGKQVVEDVKGMTTKDWPLRRNLFNHCFPDIELRVVK
ncbi:MAG: DUF1064 domain-containing protein [Sphingorhabdus sp.]